MRCANQKRNKPLGWLTGNRFTTGKMQVVRNEWTPLFNSLKEKVSAQGRKRLLFQCIGEIQDITILNFGTSGIARPEPWSSLSLNYAQERHGGNTTPTLILSGEMRQSFVHVVSENSASLTNVAPYADEHQFGLAYRKLPARPYYPVSADGSTLTPFAEDRLREVLVAHFK